MRFSVAIDTGASAEVRKRLIQVCFALLCVVANFVPRIATCDEVDRVGESVADRCVSLAATHPAEALTACREARQADADDPAIGILTAELEFEVGDPARSARIWAELIEQAGWRPELARGHAMALWRAGDPQAAEPILRDLVARVPSVEAETDLIVFLLAMDRPSEAAEAAAEAVRRHPATCEIEEFWGQALAELGEHAGAAGHFGAAVAKGCPPYRWTRLGTVPNHLGLPPYQSLLVPEELVSGLDGLDDDQCLRRFELLRTVMNASVTPKVTDQVLSRSSREIQLAGIGLVASVGRDAMASWERLLASDDLMIRKQALRRILQLHDPAFIPLLERHLEVESLPGNRNLTALALGELLQETDPVRGAALLEAIPADDPSYPRAREALRSSDGGGL